MGNLLLCRPFDVDNMTSEALWENDGLLFGDCVLQSPARFIGQVQDPGGLVRSEILAIVVVGHNPVIDTIVYQLNHTPWQGLRYYDLIWPSFMLMTGMSLPFSYAKRSLTQTHREIFLRVARRALVLFLLGSIRESVNLKHPYLVELSSALQPIGIAYFCAFLLVRKSWRFQAAVGASILAGYALLLAFVPVPGVPAGSYQQGKNLVAADIAVLGRTHEEGW